MPYILIKDGRVIAAHLTAEDAASQLARQAGVTLARVLGHEPARADVAAMLAESLDAGAAIRRKVDEGLARIEADHRPGGPASPSAPATPPPPPPAPGPTR